MIIGNLALNLEELTRFDKQVKRLRLVRQFAICVYLLNCEKLFYCPRVACRFFCSTAINSNGVFDIFSAFYICFSLLGFDLNAWQTWCAKTELKLSPLAGAVHVSGEEKISSADIWLYCIIIYVAHISSLFKQVAKLSLIFSLSEKYAETKN